MYRVTKLRKVLVDNDLEISARCFVELVIGFF
jgi:hypothetical protein